VLVGAVLGLAAAGYAVAPSVLAGGPPAMTLGHVPTASTALTGAVVVGPGGAVLAVGT